MKCPACSVDLVMSDRQGVEIDYCPTCRGVWLDRGELDKIIERSYAAAGPAQQQNVQPQQKYYGDDDYFKQKKRKNFLDDIFDF